MVALLFVGLRYVNRQVVSLKKHFVLINLLLKIGIVVKSRTEWVIDSKQHTYLV